MNVRTSWEPGRGESVDAVSAGSSLGKRAARGVAPDLRVVRCFMESEARSVTTFTRIFGGLGKLVDFDPLVRGER